MIIFRCNAGPAVGFGHLFRCRTLAAALRAVGEQSVMVGPAAEYRAGDDGALFADWIPATEWSSAPDDAEKFLRLAHAAGATAAVLDDYRIDDDYQRTIRAAGLPWLQFAGVTRHNLWADAFVDPGPGEQSEFYAPFLRIDGVRLLLGPRYAALRPMFAGLPAVERSGVRRILVTFGGGDDRGAILSVLSALMPATAPGIEFTVVSGRHNPRNPQIAEWIAAHGAARARLHIDSPDILRLFNACDLAVMGGGTTTYEAAACCLPMVLIAIADNQVRQAAGWEKSGAGIFPGPLDQIGSAELASHCLGLIEDTALRKRMSETGRALVDGRGAERLAQELLRLSSR
jgi:UDP-2,4-diacetamido-2,4,6-trideoxy-beta-L-altropyranose hydrolase